MRRDVDGDALSGGAPVTLALIAMVMRVQDRVHFCHADLAEQSKDVSRTEVDEQGAVAILQQIDVASVLQKVEMGRDAAELAVGQELNARAGLG